MQLRNIVILLLVGCGLAACSPQSPQPEPVTPLEVESTSEVEVDKDLVQPEDIQIEEPIDDTSDLFGAQGELDVSL